jgi:hypothetical protein
MFIIILLVMSAMNLLQEKDLRLARERRKALNADRRKIA